MRRWKFHAFLLCIAAGAGALRAQEKSLSLTHATGREVPVSVTMTSDEAVQGFELSVGVNPVMVSVVDVIPAGATNLYHAELIESEIVSGGFTMRVIMDHEAPWGGQVIPAGFTRLVAMSFLRAAINVPKGETVSSPIVFRDGLGDPPRVNSILVGGSAIGAAEGLGLIDGMFTITSETSRVSIASASGQSGDLLVELPVVAANVRPVDGYLLPIGHEPGVRLSDITTDGTAADAVGIEYQLVTLYAGGGTISVVFDYDPPYTGKALPPGSDNTLARLRFAHDHFACTGDPAEERYTYAVGFADGVFGTPPAQTMLIEEGETIHPLRTNGAVTFVCQSPCDLNYWIGGEPFDGSTEMRCASGEAGKEAMVTLYYTAACPHIQGMSMAVCYPTDLTVTDLDETGKGVVAARHIAGTATEAAAAEFVSFNASSETGELIVGILVDSTPPVPPEHTLPASSAPLAVFNVFFLIPPDAVFGMRYALDFCEGILGAGTVPIYNRAAVSNGSVPANLHPGCIVLGCEVNYYVGQATGGDHPTIECATGVLGEEAEVTLYYDASCTRLQGISMALCYPNELSVLDLDEVGQGVVSEKHLAGTLTETLNAEFVEFNANNAAGELIVGILVDATPPVPIDHLYPPRDTPEAVLKIFFALPPDATCLSSYPLRFCEGITGAGEVPIFNRAAIFNRSVPVRTHDGCLTARGRAPFIRGDCQNDERVDVADPAATMSYLFLGTLNPLCLDACDSNDDGVIDLADVTSTLRFLFKLGPILPPPGPYPPGGFDPTPDRYGIDLGCALHDPCP
jgi:hypothetical protein